MQAERGHRYTPPDLSPQTMKAIVHNLFEIIIGRKETRKNFDKIFDIGRHSSGGERARRLLRDKNDSMCSNENNKLMAREKPIKGKGQPKKMMATMTVKKEKAPEPKYIISHWWTSMTEYVVKRRLNPDYKPRM